MDIRLQELSLIFVVSLCAALSLICIWIRKKRVFDYDKSSPRSFSKIFTNVCWFLSFIFGITCTCVLIMSILQN